MNHLSWHLASFLLYSVCFCSSIITPKIRSSDTNMMTFFIFLFSMSSHTRTLILCCLQTSFWAICYQSLTLINWFLTSQIHTLTKFYDILQTLSQQFFSILLDLVKFFSNCCFWLPYYISSKTHNLLFESFYIHLFISKQHENFYILLKIILMLSNCLFCFVKYKDCFKIL